MKKVYIFNILPTLKSVVLEIQNENYENGEPYYQGQKIKYYL